MHDQELSFTNSHSADEFEGTILGIETTLFFWVAVSSLAGIALFGWLFYGRGRGFREAAFWAAIPVLVVVVYLRLFHQGKPPGYTGDLIDSVLTNGHATPPHQSPPHPLYDV